MRTKHSAQKQPLTILAIGSSQSSHVVSRVRCFAQRGHRVYLLSGCVCGVEGVTEITVQDVLSPFLRRTLGWINACSIKALKRSVSSFTGAFSQVLNYFYMLKKYEPDIVHVHYAYSLWAWLAAVADHHPLVVSIMGGDILFDEQGSPTPRGKWLTLQLLKSCDLITSKSDYLITVLRKLGGFDKKAVKVVWGVDLGVFARVDTAALREKLGIFPKQRVILSPKILQPFYNVHLIVEALPWIEASYPGTRLLITEYAADPEYRDQIVERVAQLGLQEYVIFVGHIPHHEMPLYYSLADITVAVPSSDGLPQTLVEGMACGVPNVVSRLPRYEELVTHGESAYFVDASVKGIADGVNRVFSDRELAERIVHNGREIVVAKADFEEEVSRVEAKYYELLAMPRKRRSLLARFGVLVAILRYFTAH